MTFSTGHYYQASQVRKPKFNFSIDKHLVSVLVDEAGIILQKA